MNRALSGFQFPIPSPVALIGSVLMVVTFAPPIFPATDCPPPGAVHSLSPCCGEEIDHPRPVLRWQGDGSPSWFYLWINKDGAAYHKEWLRGSQSWSPTNPMPAGKYKWWVRTWNPCGNGPWSESAQFTLQCKEMERPILQSPADDSSLSGNGEYLFTWAGSPDATWAHIWFEEINLGRERSRHFHNKWHRFDPQTALGLDYPSDFFPTGTFNWWIREWNPCGGYGPWTDSGNPFTFTVGKPVVAAQTPPGPTGNLEILWDQGSSGSRLRPRLVWDDVKTADRYYVWLEKDGEALHREWVQGTTHLDLTFDLDDGDYRFWVRTANSKGEGPWSDPTTVTRFKFLCPQQDRVQGLRKKDNFLDKTTDQLTLVWEPIEEINWYQVVVEKAGKTVLKEWFDLQRDSTRLFPSGNLLECRLPIEVRHGEYVARVMGWAKPCGGMEWSDDLRIGIDCALSKPVNLKTEGTPTLQRPTFSWGRVDHVDRFVLTIERNGAPFTTETIPADALCGTETLLQNSFATEGIPYQWRADEEAWFLPLPFPFPFCGESYPFCWVHADGRITFTPAEAGQTPSVANLAAAPSLAPLWDDLRTDRNPDDDIYVQSATNQITIRWKGTYNRLNHPGPVHFSATLERNGNITFRYGEGNQQAGSLIGISSGNRRNYIVSSQSATGRNWERDIVFLPGSPRWTAFWDFPPGAYEWKVQPRSLCGGEGPVSAKTYFAIVP